MASHYVMLESFVVFGVCILLSSTWLCLHRCWLCTFVLLSLLSFLLFVQLILSLLDAFVITNCLLPIISFFVAILIWVLACSLVRVLVSKAGLNLFALNLFRSLFVIDQLFYFTILNTSQLVLLLLLP